MNSQQGRRPPKARKASHKVRLNRFLAEAGLGARRKVEALILLGRVSVDGKQETNLATEIDPGQTRVEVDGEQVTREKKVYILLNKPRGIVTSARDERGRTTVVDLVDIDKRIYPVGRLDQKSRGLVLLTNDGNLMQALLHPKHKVKKVYEVRTNRDLTEAELARLRSGVVLNGRRTAKAQIRRLTRGKQGAVFEIVLREGRKRQIRRMLRVLKVEVLDLKRTAIGGLKMGRLKEGTWRFLTRGELSGIYETD